MIQFRCSEKRGVDLETDVLQAGDNLLHAVAVAGERQERAVRICAVTGSPSA